MGARASMEINERRRNFLLPFVIIFVLGAVGVIAVSTRTMLNLTGQKAFEHLSAGQILLAKSSAASLEEFLSSRLSLIGEAAGRLSRSGVKHDTLTETLQDLQTAAPGGFLCAGVFSPPGGMRVDPPDTDVQEVGKLLQSGRSAKTAAGEVYAGFSDSGQLVVWTPVVRGNHDDAFVFAVLDSTDIRNHLKAIAKRLGHDIFLFNELGSAMMHQMADVSPEGLQSEQATPRLPAPLLPAKDNSAGFIPVDCSEERDGARDAEKQYLAYAPVRLPGTRLFLGIEVPGAAVSGYFVDSPLIIKSLAGSRVVAILFCAVLFCVFEMRRAKAKAETVQLREEQKLLTQLEESEERYKTLVENLPSSVTIFQDGRIKFANRSFHSLTQRSREELADERFNLLSLVHEDDRHLVQEDVARLLDGEKMDFPQEIRYLKRDGDVIVGLTYASLIHFGGKRAVESVVVDITRIKQMETEFAQTKQQLQYLLDNAPVMIFSLDSMGNFSYANKETLRITGYRMDDWIGKPFAPIVHPDDLALALAKFEEGRKGIPRRDFKVRIRNAEGKEQTLHIVAGSIYENNRFSGSLIIARDITEQQRLQQTIKETRDHLANIIENAGDAIITLDTVGNIVSWNKSAEGMFQFVEPYAFHKPLRSFLNVDSSRMREFVDRARQGETVRDIEIECRGETAKLNTLFTFSPIRNIAGAVIGISCFAKDITERRNFETQLERDKLFIDQLIENANALIAAANERGKIVIFNRRFEDVSGYAKEEAIGRNPLRLLVPKEHRKRLSEKFGAIREGKPILEIEIPFIAKDGRRLTVTWNAAAVNLPSGNAAIVVVGQDVTNQKRMQEELVQSKKLASIGELVSGVAHELNNPLTVIMGYSQLLISQQVLEDKHRDMAQKVMDAACRSKRIVENLLAFARKKKLEKREVDINRILESTLSLREHNLAVNNVAIIRNYDAHLPPILADGDQLQQVFLNLINNAFDAMFEAHRGGNLEVRTSKKDGWIMVEVADDGPGVPEAVQDKIFDPFFTTKEVGKGTGLGMSLSYGIVNEHGGRIYLDRTYHTGAKFVMEFPADRPPGPSNDSDM